MSTSLTSSNSLAALTAPPTFAGVSKFSSSLQQVLSRAVGIASLPLASDEAKLSDLGNRQAALQSLDATFLSLQQSITSLQTASTQLLSSSLSNAGVVTASVAAGALTGTYSIEVTDPGSYSTALSTGGTPAVTDPASSGIGVPGDLTLSVGSSDTTIHPASSSLQDIASAINSQAAGQVQATIVNVGSSASPDFRLSLTSVNLGPDAIDLKDSGGGDLISGGTAGTLASYLVGGSPTPVTSTSRTVTLAPGLTVNLVGQSTAGQPTTITVGDSPTALASAFSTFASAYNSAVDALGQQHGQGGGVLEGDSLIRELTNILSQLGTYNDGSPTSALANYGITLDQTGHLSVNTAAFTSAATADFPTLLSTLGSSSAGGFLQTATNLLSGVEDPANGLIKSDETDISKQITDQQTRIADEQARVAQLQTNLTGEISKADATIASLESQVSYVTGLFAQYTGATNTQSNGLATL
ncbi:MAG: flagellar filament capping protein FliD [Acidobacteriota bacterium]|nr:flagellar filament capping protein FliD [Acidobacteriota bacterium]